MLTFLRAIIEGKYLPAVKSLVLQLRRCGGGGDERRRFVLVYLKRGPGAFPLPPPPVRVCVRVCVRLCVPRSHTHIREHVM